MGEKLRVMEINYRRRRRDRVRNEDIRKRVTAEDSIIDKAGLKLLKWYEHLIRKGRLSKRVFQWVLSPERRKRGRPSLVEAAEISKKRITRDRWKI